MSGQTRVFSRTALFQTRVLRTCVFLTCAYFAPIRGFSLLCCVLSKPFLSEDPRENGQEEEKGEKCSPLAVELQYSHLALMCGYRGQGRDRLVQLLDVAGQWFQVLLQLWNSLLQDHGRVSGGAPVRLILLHWGLCGVRALVSGFELAHSRKEWNGVDEWYYD